MGQLYEKFNALYAAAKKRGVVTWLDGLGHHHWRMLDSKNNPKVLIRTDEGKFHVLDLQDPLKLDPQREPSADEARKLDAVLNEFSVFAPLPFLPYGRYLNGQLSSVLFVDPDSVRCERLPGMAQTCQRLSSSLVGLILQSSGT